MPTLVTAAFSSAVPKSAPGEIVYIPLGSSRINATVSGKPGSVTVNVLPEKGAAITAALQAALTARLESTVRPRLAFDHSKTGPASGHPESFSFDLARGIVLTANWSNSGRAAIEGGDYGYFSPTFLIDEDGTPCGLPDKGEIGSLVDEPAFRGIGLIASADTNPETNTTMSQVILAALAATDETAAIKAIDALRVEASEAKQNLAIAEAFNLKLIEAAAEATKVRHTSLVEAAVTAGKIAHKDEETKAQALELLEANEALGTKFLSALPATLVGLDAPIVRATGQSANGEARVEAAQAKARTELGASAGFAQVWGRAVEIDPTAFEG